MTFSLGCAAEAQLPARASSEELLQLFQEKEAALRNTPKADQVRAFGIFFEQADGTYAEEKGAVLIRPQEDESFLIGYYMPREAGDFERIGEPVRLSGARVPHVGNPRGTGTCLRAPLLDRSGEWFGCVERGKVVTGVEQP
ncbi:MAG TPA: hypothetical protein VGR37_12860 [Longimicrobiaceae bacterium]|nr:hypothetical protein [Longimicrobiaceae bacterium]